MRHTLITAALVGALIGAGSVVLYERTTATTPGQIAGRPFVIDGDTIDIQGRRIRLDMIDAPESAQLCQDAAGQDYECGRVATMALANKIGWQSVTCTDRGRDRYGRTLGVCSLGELDLNGWMVEQGYAVEYRKYSHGYYRQAEDHAKAAKTGLWAGTFQWPWDWRRERR